MKVEFISTEHNSSDLYISGKEFLKSNDSQEEYVSLLFALDAFMCFVGARLWLKSQCFRAITKQLQKNPKKTCDVRFTLCEGEDSALYALAYIVDGNVQTLVFDAYEAEAQLRNVRARLRS